MASSNGAADSIALQAMATKFSSLSAFDGNELPRLRTLRLGAKGLQADGCGGDRRKSISQPGSGRGTYVASATPFAVDRIGLPVRDSAGIPGLAAAGASHSRFGPDSSCQDSEGDPVPVSTRSVTTQEPLSFAAALAASRPAQNEADLLDEADSWSDTEDCFK
eukprot:scaffold136813_cov42-Prasinocladus_malaysianus.AAC.1